MSTLLGATLIGGVACAFAISPLVTLGGVAAARTNETMQSNLQDLTTATTPGITTMTDSAGNIIAWIYDQRRIEVPSELISPTMKDAIVAIEDRRFYEHNGVDIQGNLRAVVSNLVAGGVEQGASTITQQYVKNYLLLVAAESETEQDAATEVSIPRKLREMRMATGIEEVLSKDEILTRYLNLIPFGNNSYGIEVAARTYFGVSAAELNVPQSAFLAGVIQSSSYLNPYTNPEGATERRNTVLQAMAQAGAITAEEAAAYSNEPLGVLDSPETMPAGCIGADDRGFFCDYVVKYLGEKNISMEQLTAGSFTITTTLDPHVQDAITTAAKNYVSVDAPGVAEVMSVVEPGTDTRRVLGMTSSRDYGLNLELGQTVLPQPTDLVGNGAGSVFKIFTAAAALEQGYGVNTMLDVPKRYNAVGLGSGGARNCPAGTYCVENAGNYPARLTLQDALAQSPNTTFVQLIEKVGVQNTVDMAVRLGLRSYTLPGSFDGQSSIADYVKDNNLGSFTLGPLAVSGLELSNVAATIASEGVWCEPSPVESIVDKDGNELYLEAPTCERAVEPGIAAALANGMSKDHTNGTAQEAAGATGWIGQLAAKTGTTESNQSSAFLGFNSEFAAATYIYNDGTTISPLCTSPVRQCGNGTLFGGKEPARTWFQAANAVGASSGTLPTIDPKFVGGASATLADTYRGRSVSDATRDLESQGFRVVVNYVPGAGTRRDQVVDVTSEIPLRPGATVTLAVSDGAAPAQPTPAPLPGPEDIVSIVPEEYRGIFTEEEWRTFYQEYESLLNR